MRILYSNIEYAEKLVEIVKTQPTYYAWGAFGAPACYGNNKSRYKVPNAPSNAFLFDCAGFMYKALPWGWYGDRNRVYGGAGYPDSPDKEFYELNTNDIMSICKDVSTDFSNIMVGEALWMSGHVGLYVGNGKCAECTSAWTNGCLISQVNNCKIETGIPYKRTWTKHGKLPFVDYSVDVVPQPPVNEDKVQLQKKLINQAREILNELEVTL